MAKPSVSMGEALKRQRIGTRMKAYWARRRGEQPDERHIALPTGKIIPPDATERLRIPADVLADRDRRAAIPPASITAALMGDPPQGRSALDMRKPRLVYGRSPAMDALPSLRACNALPSSERMAAGARFWEGMMGDEDA